ncbi:hypothetical protein SAMN05192558_12132 [Actinokineospora alba]|uniref:Uncharacterized protein n=1 Tax=Actinokineospora alba TaxID=504798 RepID=A0A1H0WGG8_9PSEU|nr:hypothetical protein [Actinokineospora alba]TDP65309.1 hypothetical protein C8E96_0790 [Actinokineospora alba]SDH59435.1 hypothetical protein SAMN05421871_101612 [Actinokineospora alba]SDP89688.1 hypothetical protein SAMN05192558_12132 [Actinokineospora alba]
MRSRLAQAIDWHRPLMLFSVAMVGVAALSLVGVIVDDRMIVGAPNWLKSFKFAVSFIAYSVTWAWLMSLHPRRPRWLHNTGTLLVVAGTIEMVAITGQAFRGRRSHFNAETPFDATLWVVMGVTVAIIWTATLVVSVSVARNVTLPRPLRLAVVIGMATSLAGMLIGPLMSQRDTGVKEIAGMHSIGVVDGGPHMPITGWNLVGGDLRVGHFIGIHALQVLPLVAIVLAALVTRYAILAHEEVRTRLVWTASGVYIGLFGLVTWQAFRGQALVEPDAVTLLAFAGIVAAGAAGVAWAKAAARTLVSA